MIDSEIQSYIDRKVGKLEVRLTELEQAADIVIDVATMVEPTVEKEERRPHPASNTQIKEEKTWRLMSEVALGGSEKLTLDPKNNTHTLENTPHEALRSIAVRLNKPELVPGGIPDVLSGYESTTGATTTRERPLETDSDSDAS